MGWYVWLLAFEYGLLSQRLEESDGDDGNDDGDDGIDPGENDPGNTGGDRRALLVTNFLAANRPKCVEKERVVIIFDG